MLKYIQESVKLEKDTDKLWNKKKKIGNIIEHEIESEHNNDNHFWNLYSKNQNLKKKRWIKNIKETILNK